VLTFTSVSKRYSTSTKDAFYALRDVSFTIQQGQRIAIIGRSGSGKSTLLHLAAGLDIPSEGHVSIEGCDIATLSDRDRTFLRRKQLGLVFQFFHLLPHLSVYDNVALPAYISGEAQDLKRVLLLLDRVGLANRSKDSVQKLSGGEMQRVAICRALLAKPKLLLADEPTGNLDDTNGQQILDLLFEVTQEEKSSLIFVTHSRELAQRADQIWELHSGKLKEEGREQFAERRG